MSYLQIDGLYHSFGDKNLYQNISFSLQKGEHMGVVGQNGAGKSTFIQILTGATIPDEGRIVWQPGVSVGHLGQYANTEGEKTVLEYLYEAYAELYELQEQMQRGYDSYACTGDETQLDTASDLQQHLESAGFYQIDSEIAKVMHGLGIVAFGENTPLSQLSGGQRARVILARLLLRQVEILLLDEPTNFLDAEHVEWLGEMLCHFRGAFIVVSHDHAFLSKISDTICDLSFGQMRLYHGGYQRYLSQKEAFEQDYKRQYHTQQKHIQETEAFIRKYKAGIKSKMARGRQKQLNRLERLDAPTIAVKPIFGFSALSLTGQEILKVDQLEIGYQKPLLPAIDLTLHTGEKLVLTGFNGVGKSTLLKTLVGELDAIHGRYTFADGVRVGYYEQDLNWQAGEKKVLDELAERFPTLPIKNLRRSLAQFGVLAEHMDQPISSLSGGEQAKVKFCILSMQAYHLLLLDEPTNHLDIDAQQALRESLIAYQGSLILVSHDPQFYHGWTDRVLNIGIE